MSIDIKTMKVEPKRQTFAHVARRLGSDVPASRYEEGMYDLQATTHFHYRPIWGPEHWTYDEGRTAIKMDDWYRLRDPRQYYYGTYTIARANMHQTTERNFAFVEKRGLLSTVNDEWMTKVANYLIPLRHYEWGANMNACAITDAGYGTAVTSTTIFTAGDRLGIAQIISRIGMIMSGGDDAALNAAKEDWMNAPEWQGVRKVVEDSFVSKDWFETLVAQFLAMDGLLYPLVYNHFDVAGQKYNNASISMLCEFMVDWLSEHNRWVDAVVKVAASESEENKALLSGWYIKWRDAMNDGLKPLAEKVLGADAQSALTEVNETLNARVAKLGLTF